MRGIWGAGLNGGAQGLGKGMVRLSKPGKVREAFLGRSRSLRGACKCRHVRATARLGI